MHHTNDETKWQQSEEAAAAGRSLSERRIMSVRTFKSDLKKY
ncbi:hypothetical protein [Prochlorococcus marinus]|nr:hypothetical protein [Prochlorococcus marinus]